MPEPASITVAPESVAARTRAAIQAQGGGNLENEAEKYAEYVAMGWKEPEPDDRGRVTFNKSHRRTEPNVIRAKEILRKSYIDRHSGVNIGELATELVNLYYAQALKTRRADAEGALFKEVLKACEKKIWEGVHEGELSPEERALILPMMKNYVEKFSARGDFEKSKVRVLVRGDLQELIGETEGPVCRVETIFILLCIAVVEELTTMKVDVTSAYMNTNMPSESVKHRWVLLDADVVKVLLTLDEDYWSKYLRSDGKILVEMKKLMYGYKEAAHFWNKTLIAVFISAGYIQSRKDSCLLHKKSGNNVSYVAITVDDCFFVLSHNQHWMDEQLNILKTAFEEVTAEYGDSQQIIGMAVDFNRKDKSVSVSQRKYVDTVVERFDIKKSATTPATGNLFGDDETSPLLKDQRAYMSLVSSLMYGVKRTYPECLVSVVKLSTKYNHATESDWSKAIRVGEYMYGTREEHKMVLNPKSLQLIASSDASYAEHADGRSHTGGCVGFESDTCAWFACISIKQPQVAKSTCISELYAVNTVGEYVEWSTQVMEELGYPQATVNIAQDNQCSMQLLKVGTGSFKRSKHVKVRFFWLKELIDEGRVRIVYVPSEVLVSDCLTKPLTGARFKELRILLIGW
jgi:diphthamide synthase (EF-2-diphthine--ammonia ligase)